MNSLIEILERMDSAPRSTRFEERETVSALVMRLGGGADMDLPEEEDNAIWQDDTPEKWWYENDGDGKLTAQAAEHERIWGQERYIGCRDIYDGGAPWRNGL